MEKLYNEETSLAALVRKFKSNDEEYLKIKQTAEEKVKDVLTNGKLLLKLSMLSIIESLRRNSELGNFVWYNIPNNAHDSNCLPLMLPGQ